MNKQDTLQRAIELAIKGGWQFGQDDRKIQSVDVYQNEKYGEWSFGVMYNIYPEKIPEGYEWRNYNAHFRHPLEVIFNHDFAKALWGESVQPMAADPSKFVRYEHWLYHLQQMVIADDPLQYLADNLPEEGGA